MNKLIASGILVGASFAAAGCAAEAPIALTGQCEVVNANGEALRPTAYPLGEVAVRYHTGGSWANPKNISGSIEQDGSNYYVSVADLPTNLNNDGMDKKWNNTEAVVFVNTPTVEVGVTPDCIERDQLNQYGLPAVRVNLPTYPTAER